MLDEFSQVRQPENPLTANAPPPDIDARDRARPQVVPQGRLRHDEHVRGLAQRHIGPAVEALGERIQKVLIHRHDQEPRRSMRECKS